MNTKVLGGGGVDGYFGKNPDWSKIKVKTGRTIWSSYGDNTLQAWLVEDANSGGVALAGGNYANPIQVAGNELPGIAGYFVDGFVFENPNQVGIDASGNSWRYVGSSPLPYTVTAGTVPSSPDYELVFTNEHNNLTNRNAVGAHDDIYTRRFDTVSDLKSGVDSSGQTIDMSLMVGKDVEWLGYYSKGDGGGNKGTVKLGPHTEDGGSIFSIDSNIYIESNFKGLNIEVNKFGAVGDGLADDNAAIVNAVSFANSLTVGKRFTSPAGCTYKVKEGLKFTEGNLIFDFNDSLIVITEPLVGGARHDGSIINVRNETKQLKNVIIRNVKTTGATPDVPGQEVNHIHISWVNNFVVEGCECYDNTAAAGEGADSGIRVDGYDSNWGVNPGPITSEGFTSNGFVRGNYCHDINQGAGIQLIAWPTNITVTENITRNTKSNGIRFAGVSQSICALNQVYNVTGNRSLYMSGNTIRCDNNLVDGGTSNIGVYGVDLQDSSIKNNTIKNVGLEGIFLYNDDVTVTARCDISGNQILNHSNDGVSAWGIILRGAGCDDNNISDNLIKGGLRGINVQEIAGAKPQRNTIKGNRLDVSSTQMVVNDTIVDGGTNLVIDNIDLNTMRNTLISDNIMQFAKAATQPSSGSWQRGDIVYRSNPSVGSELGWICVSSGNPGVWAKLPDITT